MFTRNLWIHPARLAFWLLIYLPPLPALCVPFLFLSVCMCVHSYIRPWSWRQREYGDDRIGHRPIFRAPHIMCIIQSPKAVLSIKIVNLLPACILLPRWRVFKLPKASGWSLSSCTHIQWHTRVQSRVEVMLTFCTNAIPYYYRERESDLLSAQALRREKLTRYC